MSKYSDKIKAAVELLKSCDCEVERFNLTFDIGKFEHYDKLFRLQQIKKENEDLKRQQINKKIQEISDYINKNTDKEIVSDTPFLVKRLKIKDGEKIIIQKDCNDRITDVYVLEND